MNRTAIYIMLFMQLFCLAGCLPVYNPKPVCRVEDEKLIFKFDLRWDLSKRMEVAKRYDLDSALVNAAYSKVPEITIDSILWRINKPDRNYVEFSKPLGNTSIPFLTNNDVFMVEDGWIRRDEISEKAEVVFGYNDLKKEGAFSYSDTLATFFLRNHGNAEEVYLSGSFNDWSTGEVPMKKETEGWRVQIRLVPGKYTYKYIVDGKWLSDPDNLLKERQNNRGVVSIIYCPNHLFSLAEQGVRRSRVILTGNFISWKTKGISMKRSGDSWVLPMYLRDGTYAYKFLADNDWLSDPSNHDMRKDADGNLNSFLSIGRKQKFFLEGFTEAEKTILAGSFNGWSSNELVMNKTEKGWELDYAIPAGMYEYKFLVDGRWMTDPADPFTAGSGDYLNSVLAVQPTYMFELDKYPDAKVVLVTGSFNGWAKDKYHMVRRDGKWIFPVYLRPGKYLYKFVVDGNWILDPSNELWEENEYGTGNSVLWVGR
jgi:hypothetical protein